MKLLALIASALTFYCATSVKIQPSKVQHRQEEASSESVESVDEDNYVAVSLADLAKEAQQGSNADNQEEAEAAHHYEEVAPPADASTAPPAETEAAPVLPERKIKDDKVVKGSDEELQKFLQGLQAFVLPEHSDQNKQQEQKSNQSQSFSLGEGDINVGP